METVLQAKNVRKIYGSKGNVYTALENISIDIKEGEFTGIMYHLGQVNPHYLTFYQQLTSQLLVKS